MSQNHKLQIKLVSTSSHYLEMKLYIILYIYIRPLLWWLTWIFLIMQFLAENQII